MDSSIVLEGRSLFDYDPESLKKVLRIEGKEVAKISRRLVSRRAISKAGEFAGKQSGLMQKSLKSKVSRSGMMVIITHVIPSGQVRYPFILAYGSSKTNLKPREDHMQIALKQRRSATRNALRSALHKTILAR